MNEVTLAATFAAACAACTRGHLLRLDTRLLSIGSTKLFAETLKGFFLRLLRHIIISNLRVVIV